MSVRKPQDFLDYEYARGDTGQLRVGQTTSWLNGEKQPLVYEIVDETNGLAIRRSPEQMRVLTMRMLHTFFPDSFVDSITRAVLAASQADGGSSK